MPPAQAEQIVDALWERHLPHAYLLFPGEDHGFRSAANIIRSFEARAVVLRPGLRVRAGRRDRADRGRPSSARSGPARRSDAARVIATPAAAPGFSEPRLRGDGGRRRRPASGSAADDRARPGPPDRGDVPRDRRPPARHPVPGPPRPRRTRPRVHPGPAGRSSSSPTSSSSCSCRRSCSGPATSPRSATCGRTSARSACWPSVSSCSRRSSSRSSSIPCSCPRWASRRPLRSARSSPRPTRWRRPPSSSDWASRAGW